MPTDDKQVKIYKNPARKSPDLLKKYTPQYQNLGIEPTTFNSSLSATQRVSLAKPSMPEQDDNPRTRRPNIRQPYAETTASPIGRGRGPLPNVGNNIEQTWSSVDGELVDDVFETNQPMIDNNDYVTEEALGQQETNYEKVVSFLSEDQLQDAVGQDYMSSILDQLQEDEYLLFVDKEPVCSGTLAQVQDELRSLIFGEHPAFPNRSMSPDDIVVIKRVKLKVGVFLE
jgi:hypothetical protein